jgi:hypothetical protein
MEQLVQLIQHIFSQATEFCNEIISFQGPFDTTWVLIIAIFVIAISGIASFK